MSWKSEDCRLCMLRLLLHALPGEMHPDVLCCAMLWHAVLCHAVMCCAVLCCAVLCCAVLCCAVMCCLMLPFAAEEAVCSQNFHYLCAQVR